MTDLRLFLAERMASSLRKYKFSGSTAARPNTSSSQGSSDDRDVAPSHTQATSGTEPTGVDIADLKAEILVSLKSDITAVIREQLRNALSEDFNFLKTELQAVRSEIANSTAATRTEIDQMKANMKDMESGLSEWSDEVTTLQTTVRSLQKELTDLRGKCEDMEGRMRRCNIRILGVPEEPGSSSTTSVSKLLKDMLKLDKDIIIDRSHRSLAPKRQDGKPRAIIAKLHHYQDCVEILRRARTQSPLRLNGAPVAIFPDYTTTVARARAAFTEVRKLLHNQQGVRFGILYPARLRITYNGQDKEFLDPREAMVYVKNNIIKPTEDEM